MLYSAFSDLEGAHNEAVLAAKLYKQNEIELKKLGVDPNASLEEKLEALKEPPIEAYHSSQAAIASNAAASLPDVYGKVKKSGAKFFFTGELGEQFSDGLSLQEAIDGGYTYKGMSVAHLIRREIAAEHFLLSGGAKLSPTAIRTLYSTPVQEFLKRATVEEGNINLKNQAKIAEVKRVSNFFQSLDNNPAEALAGRVVQGIHLPGSIEEGIAIHGSFEASIAATIVDLENGVTDGHTSMKILEGIEDGQYWSKTAQKFVSLEEFSPLLAQNIARLKQKVASRDRFAGDQDIVTLTDAAKDLAEKLGPKDEFGFYTIKNEQELGTQLRDYIRDNPDKFTSGFNPSQQDIQGILNDFIVTRDEADDSDYASLAIQRFEAGQANWIHAYRKIQSDKVKQEVDTWIKEEYPRMAKDIEQVFQTNSQIGKELVNLEANHSITAGGTFDLPYATRAAKLHYKYAYVKGLNQFDNDHDQARAHAIGSTLDFLGKEENWNKQTATGVANISAVNNSVTQALIAASTKSGLPNAPVNGDEVKLLKAVLANGYMPKYIKDFVYQTKYKFGGLRQVLDQRIDALEASGQLSKKEAANLKNQVNNQFKPRTLGNSVGYTPDPEAAGKAETTGAPTLDGAFYDERQTHLGLTNISEASVYTNREGDAQANNVEINGKFEDVNTVLGQEGPITFSNIQSMIITDNKKFRTSRWGKYGFTSQQMLKLRELGYFDEADEEFTEENQTLALFELMKDVNANAKNGLNGALLASTFDTITRSEGRLITQLLGAEDSFLNSAATLSPEIFSAALTTQEELGVTEGPGGSPAAKYYSGPIDLRVGTKGRFEIAESIGETLAGVKDKYGRIDPELTYKTLWRWRQKELRQVLGNARFEFLKKKATHEKTGFNEQRFYELLLKEKEFADVDTTAFESRKAEVQRIQVIKTKYKSNKDYRYKSKNKLGFPAEKSIIDRIYGEPWSKFDQSPVILNNSFNNQMSKILGADKWNRIKNSARRDAFQRFPPLDYYRMIQLELRELKEFQ